MPWVVFKFPLADLGGEEAGSGLASILVSWVFGSKGFSTSVCAAFALEQPLNLLAAWFVLFSGGKIYRHVSILAALSFYLRARNG